MSIFNIANASTLLLMLCLSCSGNDHSAELNYALTLSGSHKNELVKVLEHFEEDSLKLEAAKYLIENMAGKYAVISDDLLDYDTLFSGIADLRNDNRLKRDLNQGNIFPGVDSIWQSKAVRVGPLSRSNARIETDLEHINSEFLINNINMAFHAWEFPWAQDLDFNEFCEYILPYRVADERLSPWRSLVLDNYQREIDSLVAANVSDPIEVGIFFNRILAKGWESNPTFLKYPFAMTYDDLSKSEMGLCLQETQYAVFVMRAIGIPVTWEKIPHYGNRNRGHDFYSIRHGNGQFIDFEINDTLPGQVVRNRNTWNYRIPKILRKNFTSNDNSLFYKTLGEYNIPPLFINSGLEDVTDQYITVSDITLDRLEKLDQIVDYLYLCIFDNHRWQAVQWTKINNGEPLFKDMGRGIVYMPMVYLNGKYKAIDQPIILEKNGTLKKIKPEAEPTELTLLRKSHIIWPPNKLNMYRGKFQVSNDPLFTSRKNVYDITSPIRLTYHTISLPPDNRRYRYARYVFPDSTGGNIAELEFWGEHEKVLIGKIIADSVTRKEGALHIQQYFLRNI